MQLNDFDRSEGMNEKRDAAADRAACEAVPSEMPLYPSGYAKHTRTALRALPHWIDRAEAAEAENERLGAMLDAAFDAAKAMPDAAAAAVFWRHMKDHCAARVKETP